MKFRVRQYLICLLPLLATYWGISALLTVKYEANNKKVVKPVAALRRPVNSKREAEYLALKSISTSSSVCHTPQCIAFFDLRYFQPRIPRIRHILWRSSQVPGYFAKHLASWQALQPNWTYVLWRDSDLVRFVAKHYPRALSKFQSLKEKIMRIDMVRYMILHKFGGVYADLDYTLVKSLDKFLKFPAVVTRETEAHSLLQFGMNTYPPKLLGNPAFLMSQPGHPFFQFSIEHLIRKKADFFYEFAGPIAVTKLLSLYAEKFPIQPNSFDRLLIVPASRCFYPYDNNNLASSQSMYKRFISWKLNDMCSNLKRSSSSIAKQLKLYCQDISNLDPITDRNEPVYAIHDFNKSTSSYDPSGSIVFNRNLLDIRSLLPGVTMADALY